MSCEELAEQCWAESPDNEEILNTRDDCKGADGRQFSVRIFMF